MGARQAGEGERSPHENPAIIITLTLLAGQALAQPISYQSYLEQQGQPFSGTATLEFRLFTAASGGTQIGATKTRSNWPIEDGLFQVELDFGSDAFTGAARYLQIRVDGTLLNPRQQVTHAPMALHALSVDLGSIDGDFWRRGGNAGTSQPEDFIGTTDAQPFVIRANNFPIFQMRPATSTEGEGSAPSLIAGYHGNHVPNNIRGATISGGGREDAHNEVTGRFGTIGGGTGNVTGMWGTVAGGSRNSAVGFSSMVGGGSNNTASGDRSVVAGGVTNTASGDRSTVGGGELNCAGARYSWAGGHRAKVRPGTGSGDAGTGCLGIQTNGADGDVGSFVWSDTSVSASFISERPNQFRVRAHGGADFQTGTRGLKSFSDGTGINAAAIQAESLHSAGIALFGLNESTDSTLVITNRGSGPLLRAFRSGGFELMQLDNNGNLLIAGTLTQGSDRANKQDLKPIDLQAVLDQLAKLEISSWRYLHSDPTSRHIGPMAQDFHAAFGYGVSDDSISSIDAQGIAFAAIQALNERFGETRLAVDQQLGRLEQENLELRAEVAALNEQSDQVRELINRNAELEARLATLESLLLESRSMAAGR